MCWLVAKIAPDGNAKSKSSKPSHFTIPILSPFTSVVGFHASSLVPVRDCDLRGIGRTRDWCLWHQGCRYLRRDHRDRGVCRVKTPAFSMARTITVGGIVSRGWLASLPEDGRPILEQITTISCRVEHVASCPFVRGAVWARTDGDELGRSKRAGLNERTLVSVRLAVYDTCRYKYEE